MKIMKSVIVLTALACMNLAHASRTPPAQNPPGSDSNQNGGLAPEMDFSGSSSFDIYHTHTDGGAVASCAATFWFLGGTCWEHVGYHNFDTRDNSGTDVSTSIVIKTWGEGKVQVSLKTDKAYGCAGIQKAYVGYVTAYETFNLYELSGNATDVNPATAEPSATLSIERKAADLKLFADITAQTQDSDGKDCAWKLSKDTALSYPQEN